MCLGVLNIFNKKLLKDIYAINLITIMLNNNILTEIQQNSIREYNKEAQHKFIKENPNYYSDQYKKHREARLIRAREKYQQKKIEKEKEKEKENIPIKSFTDRALDAYAERVLKELPSNLTNGNIVFIYAPPVV